MTDYNLFQLGVIFIIIFLGCFIYEIVYLLKKIYIRRAILRKNLQTLQKLKKQ